MMKATNISQIAVISPIVWMAILSVAQQVGPPQPHPQLSLAEAARTALQHHPALQKAEAEVEAADAQIKQVRANYFPQLSFTSIGKVGLSGATGALGLAGFPGSPFYRNIAGSVNWYQSIFDFGRTEHHIASQKALAEAARLKQKAEEQRILLNVTRAYLGVLEAQELRAVADKTVQERKLTLRRVRAYFQAEMRSQLDVDLAEANLADAESTLLHAENSLRTAFSALQVAMGLRGISPEYQLTQLAVAHAPLPSLNDEIQAALKARPELQALDLKVNALSEDVGVKRSNELPELRGFAAGGAGRFNGTTVKPEQRHGVGGIGIFMPLFTGGRLKGEQLEAEANLKAAVASREDFHQQIGLDVTQTYYRLLELEEQMRVLDEQKRAAQDALRLAQSRFKAQLASFLELTTAELAATQAEAKAAQAGFDYQRAQTELRFSTGQSLTP